MEKKTQSITILKKIVTKPKKNSIGLKKTNNFENKLWQNWTTQTLTKTQILKNCKHLILKSKQKNYFKKNN